MDENAMPSTYNRNAAFGEGAVGGQFMPSQSLQETAQRFNALVPRSYRPSSSGNGMSRSQYQATLGGAFPTNNGMAQNQYEVAKYSMGRGV
jgi:hypothetical protein